MAEDVGLYKKFNVSRTDGRERPGQKHFGCRYFVLDLDHDPHAPAAIRAYAKSLGHVDTPDGSVSLAIDLMRWLETGAAPTIGHPRPKTSRR